MTSQPGSQLITIHILLNISRNKGNQKYFFIKIDAENETKRLVTGIFLFLKKALYEVKASDLQLNFNIFR